jgi:hypothetical protein
VLVSVPRVRLVCTHVPPNLLQFLTSTPRPPELPGTQLASILDNYFWRGTAFPQSIHLTDLGVFWGPGDVDEMQAYCSYNMLQVNVTRVCLTYVAVDCAEPPEVCVTNAVHAMLKNKAHTGGLSQRALVAAIVVPIVAAGGSDRSACGNSARVYCYCMYGLEISRWVPSDVGCDCSASSCSGCVVVPVIKGCCWSVECGHEQLCCLSPWQGHAPPCSDVRCGAEAVLYC